MKRTAWAFALGCCLLPASLVSAQAEPGAMVPVEGGQVYAETCGKPTDRAIVLLHDGVLHSAAFDPVWPDLCRRYRVVRYDRRGFGRSPAPTAPYASTDDVEAVMRAAGVAHATIIGGSEGGGLAVQFALAHPEQVDRLILVGPSISGLPVSAHFIKRGQATIGAVLAGDFEGAMKDPYVLAPDHVEARARALALLRANPQNLTHPNTAREAPPAAKRLGEIKVPTLILVGDKDIADVQAWAGEAEVLIPGARRVVIPDAGHLIYFEQPGPFIQQVGAFVR